MRSPALLILAVVFAIPAAGAADVVPPSLAACAQVANDRERLACYDLELARLSGNAPAAAPTTPEDLFGASSIKPSPVAAPAVAATSAGSAAATAAPQREELNEITATVKTVTTLGDGKLRIELDNGQVWQQISSGSATVKPGMEAKVSRASMGSFMLTATGSNRSLRVRRLR